MKLVISRTPLCLQCRVIWVSLKHTDRDHTLSIGIDLFDSHGIVAV